MRTTTSVSRDRWLSAQAWEKAFWEKQERKRGWRRGLWPLAAIAFRLIGSDRAWGDDWNHWWAAHFDNYSFLPERLGDYIELGCGPYTNTRIILNGRSADRAVCSDPLADTYVQFRTRWLAHAHRQGNVELDVHPIEELPFPPNSFDVVVMINVLDHVRDARACMAISTNLVRDGGYFILGQDLRDLNTVGDYEWFDAGHPIRLTADELTPYLATFDAVIDKTLASDESRGARLLAGHVVFAGRKRPA